MKSVSQQQGFTLIELIVVIVILGILAVTAAPKFIDFTDKAEASAIKGLKGAIEGAMTVTYSDAAINGVADKSAADAAGAGTTVPTNFGYPRATADSLLAAMSISAAADLSADYVYFTDTVDDIAVMYIAPSSDYSDDVPAETADLTGCYVTYTEATADNIAKAVVTC